MERRVFEADRLMSEHPPVLRHPNKRVVYEIACPPGCVHGGRLTYTRWRAMPLPERAAPAEALRLVERREDVYDYALVLVAEAAVEWHVNFADPHLFFAYGSGLFAQDEIQAAEHPSLGTLREALAASGASALTAEGGRPTPVLVMGAKRRCRVATDRDEGQGRPRGLYGNLFTAASEDAVRRAVKRIDPPTVTNLIAMAAPTGGFGRYGAEEIESVLTTAFTGFRAAVLESGGASVAVHTGFWGCGAFGGNRVLMALLQFLAAGMAQVRRLVFHTFDASGTAAFDSALRRIEDFPSDRTLALPYLVDRIVAMEFEWSVGDGN